MHDAQCIFCKIVAGELPAYTVYEDEHTLAFLDIAPFAPGHLLVISKWHANYLTDLPDEQLRQLFSTVKKVAAKVMQNLPCDGFNLLQNNGACASQVVPHVHVHVIPRHEGVAARWSAMEPAPTAEEFKTMQAMIRGSNE